MTKQPILLSDYQPHPYRIETCTLHIRLDPTQTHVTSTLLITSQTESISPLVLDGESLELVSISMDDSPISGQITPISLTLPGFIGQKTIKIETRISPSANTELEGIYWVNGTFCSQNEPEGFRKITYFIDRPDNLTRFTTIMDAIKSEYPILLSNGNLIAQSVLANGYHRAVWEDPFPKPCYLFALVAGQFDRVSDTFTTQSGRTVLLEIYADPGNGPRCHYALEALKRSMKWDESQYNCEYDLDRFMIVAIDSFNMGAMENKGLNIFNSAYILADPQTATDTDYMNVEGVVAHEYFHNWTGNRVTCRDWFQLTLKEGLTVYRDQEFSADMNSRGVKRISDVRVLKEVQFTEDAGPMAHPIQPKHYIEINNFYTATVYNKGAEVIRMMATLTGESTFRDGVKHYLKTYDGQAATTENFVSSIERVSGDDLSQFRTWYHQLGTPTVTITPTRIDSTVTKWTLEQTCRPTQPETPVNPFVIPIRIGLLSAQTGAPIPFRLNDSPLAVETVYAMTRQSETVTIYTNEPAVPSILRGLSAPVTLQYPYTEADLLTLLAYDTDPVNRFEASQRLYESMILSLFHNNTADLIATIAAFRELLESAEDPAVIATCIQMPSLNRLVDITPNFDIDGIRDAKEFLISEIRCKLNDGLNTRYQATRSRNPYAPTPDQIGQRKLNATILSLLSDQSDEANRRLLNHYVTATNMTDQLAALTIATHVGAACADTLQNDFHARWKSDSNLVMKWLQVQSTAPHGDALARVKALSVHPTYNPKVPNQFRALVGGFSSNLTHFHQSSGAGYNWVADRIIALDPINPQIAAKVALSFQKAAQTNTERLRKIDEALTRILAKEPISKNLFEVVSRIKHSYNLPQ